MKKLLTLLLFCAFGLSAFGQEVEPVLPDSLFAVPQADKAVSLPAAKKAATWRRNVVAVSFLYSSPIKDAGEAPFNSYIDNMSGTPYTEYYESQYVASRAVISTGLSLQYYRAFAKKAYLGVIGSVGHSAQTLYKRTTKQVVNRYERTNLLLAPVLRYTLMDDDIPDFFVYGSAGASAMFSVRTLGGENTLTLQLRPLISFGLVIGERLFFFQETGTTFSSVFGNVGIGFKF